MTTHGIHHVTAVTAQASENLKFYTGVLGLRLVKKTVNQDDTSAYHLFYADAAGTPGTDMTFFDWPHAGEKMTGTDTISRTMFRVNSPESLDYWEARLSENGAKKLSRNTIFGRRCLAFEDFEGQALGLVEDGSSKFEGTSWQPGEIPEEHLLKGFYAIMLNVPFIRHIDPVFTKILKWANTGSYIDTDGHEVIVYSMDGGGPGKEVHVREIVDVQPLYLSTAGSVHHAAFRVKTEEDLKQWIDFITKIGVPNSGLVDRFYFKSLYFRISPGILFELATDGPGFAADEDPEHLGEKLSLPPFLESHRAEIEANLQPL